MSKLKYRTLALSLIAGLGASQLAYAVTATPTEIDPENRAKIAKERSRRVLEPKQGSAKGSTSECGSVDIGNIFTGGRRGRMPREVNVIVTGDVINANNKCK